MTERASIRTCPVCGASLQMELINGRLLAACSNKEGCSFVFYNNPVPVAAVLIPHSSGGLVLVKRKFPPQAGLWALPAGFVNQDEAPEAAARRESEEETALAVTIERLFGLAKSPERNHIIIFYLAHPVSGDPVGGDDAEEARVFPIEDLTHLELAFPLHRQAVDRWLSEQESTGWRTPRRMPETPPPFPGGGGRSESRSDVPDAMEGRSRDG